MDVKLIILKSGEDLISEVYEMHSENEKVIGYFLKRPCIVKIKDFTHQKEPVEENPEQTAKFNIVLYPWIPLTSSEIIPIPADWVVTMVDPVQKLFNMYKDQVLEYKNDQNNSTDK